MAAKYPSDEDDRDSLTSANSLRNRVRNVGIFWDMNTCGLPADCQTAESASLCVINLKGAFVSSRSVRLTMFRVIVDEESCPREVIKGVMSSDVDKFDMFKVQNTVPKFEKAIMDWLESEGVTESDVATDGQNDPILVLVTGDGDFVRLLARLRHRMGIETTVVHPVGNYQTLRAVAKKSLLFSKFVPSKKEPKSSAKKPTVLEQLKPVEPEDEEDDEGDENVQGGKIKVQCYKNVNLDFTKCIGELNEKVCKRYRGYMGRKAPHYVIVHFQTADIAAKAAKELNNKLVLHGVVVQAKVVGRSGRNQPKAPEPIKNGPLSDDKKKRLNETKGADNHDDDLEAAFQALSVDPSAAQKAVKPLMPGPRNRAPRAAHFDHELLISCSKLPSGWYLQDKPGSLLVQPTFDSRVGDRVVRVPLIPPALDSVSVYYRAAQFGPVLRMTHVRGAGSSGEGVEVEFATRAGAQNCLKSIQNSQSAPITPQKPQQRLQEHPWKGIGIVRILWPKRMHRGSAFLVFSNPQRAQFVLGKFPGGTIEIPLRISPATTVRFSNVKIGPNPSFPNQLRLDGCHNVVHEESIRNALHAVDVSTDDLKVNLTYVGKVNGPDTKEVKSEVQSLLSQVPVQRTAPDFKASDPNSKSMNDHGNVFVYDPIEGMMCTEWLFSRLKLRGAYINCDFIIDLNLPRKIYEDRNFTAVVTQAIKEEDAMGHVAWVCVKTKTRDWNALRLSSLHLGRIIRVVRNLGKQFMRVEYQKLRGNKALVEWLLETKAGEDMIRDLPIWFDFGIPYVPKFLETSPIWNKLQIRTETQKQAITVESGVLGKLVDKFGPRMKSSLRTDFHLTMDPSSQMLTLTCPLESSDILAARSLLGPFAKVSAASSRILGKSNCVLCASEAQPSGKRHVVVGCGHEYCQKCFLALAYWTPIPLRCASPSCAAPLTASDIKVASMLFSQLDPIGGGRFEEKLALAVGPNKPFPTTFFPCPTLGCTAIFVSEASAGNREARATCQECGNELCLRCRCFYHYAETCDLYKLWLDGVTGKSVTEWIRRDMDNRGLCRSCSKPVERRYSDIRNMSVPLGLYCAHCLRLLEDNDVLWASAALARLKPRTQRR